MNDTKLEAMKWLESRKGWRYRLVAFDPIEDDGGERRVVLYPPADDRLTFRMRVRTARLLESLAEQVDHAQALLDGRDAPAFTAFKPQRLPLDLPVAFSPWDRKGQGSLF